MLQDLQSEGLHVTSAVVVVDREQGGNYNLSEKGVTMHSLCTLSQVRQICVRSLNLSRTVQSSSINFQLPVEHYITYATVEGQLHTLRNGR